MAMNEGAHGVAPRRPLDWSGRRDSNPRSSAWEADAVPLSYSRVTAEKRQNCHRPIAKCPPPLPRPEAWEAGILPLNYARPWAYLSEGLPGCQALCQVLL